MCFERGMIISYDGIPGDFYFICSVNQAHMHICYDSFGRVYSTVVLTEASPVWVIFTSDGEPVCVLDEE